VCAVNLTAPVSIFNRPSLEQRLKQQAHAEGFDLAGIAPAAEADGFGRLREWLGRGYAGEMAYMPRHADARRHPAGVLPEVRSVLMVGMSYEFGVRSSELKTNPNSELGKVARYARGGLDYHDVLRERLNRLLAWVKEQVPDCSGRGVVDTAPLLERGFARRAGLGWFGKNTMLINKRRGSYLFLGALLLDLELKPDEPHAGSHCGSCTACLDACPTGALVGPGWLDARKCISYLTIEVKGAVPEELRPGVGDWLFGCDVCQEVCPWNRKPAGLPASFPAEPGWEALDAVELLGLDEEAFRRRFRGTPMFRTRRRGLLRNACVVLGNTAGPEVLEALRRAAGDPEPIIRDAAEWAIARIEARQRAATR
jgi:epoxyqueuosine reductase